MFCVLKRCYFLIPRPVRDLLAGEKKIDNGHENAQTAGDRRHVCSNFACIHTYIIL